MIISKASLEEILRCREQRAARQRELIECYGMPVACFTMNIPGEVKHTLLIEFAFREGLKRFEALMPAPAAREVSCVHTGCEALLAYDLDAAHIKKAALAIEQADAVGRLYDIDVIDVAGEKLSRTIGRECLICGGPAAVCARSRAHGLDALLAQTNALLQDFAARTLASLAHEALLIEVDATPKPGLVDCRNCGAHRDMDRLSFHQSAVALRPHFESMVREALGYDGSPESLMQALRKEGLAAERAMLAITNGANTHKGAIFSMGLALAGAGIYLTTGENALAAAARLAQVELPGALERALEAPITNGERVFAKTGALGARGQAAEGFPAARFAKAALEGFLAQGYSVQDAAVLTLPVIMEELIDTNLLHRGAEEGLRFAQKSAARVNALPEEERFAALCTLDEAFIARNLSPGGCADVLSLALLLHALEEHVAL